MNNLAQLAADEALLNHVERTGEPWLRLWLPEEPMIVLGYANELEREADTKQSRRLAVPINRRISGGGTVMLLPGSLCFALCLPIVTGTPFEHIPTTNRFIMETHRSALETASGRVVTVNGVSDLAVSGRKFAGNAQKRGRAALLFHGSLLLEADLDLISGCLRHPTSEPDWRARRSHAEFLTNLNLAPDLAAECLVSAWRASKSAPPDLGDEITALVEHRYSRPEWAACR